MTRGQAFCAVALEGLIQLQANELGLCALSPDVEYVHQARVALRRLRSALRLFGPALPASFGRRWAPVWQMHARSLGLARDWDVFCTEWMPRLKTLPGTDTAMSWLETHALAQRAAAHMELGYWPLFFTQLAEARKLPSSLCCAMFILLLRT